ncbi:hypothetical protein K1719_022703 [Acacia pycnantha]|nr:hypothetical protein K1719_022703 [Acacia pycnantha]
MRKKRVEFLKNKENDGRCENEGRGKRICTLSDITNTPSSSNYMQRNISCLTYRSKLTLSPPVHPQSQSVNQKKSVKKSSKEIRQVATDLCSRLNPPVYQNSRVNNDEPDRTNHHKEPWNNLSSIFRSTYLDDGDACHVCQVCGAEMWLAERLKGVKKSEMPQFGICCCNGNIIVPLLRRPPKELEELFFSKQSVQSIFF